LSKTGSKVLLIKLNNVNSIVIGLFSEV